MGINDFVNALAEPVLVLDRSFRFVMANQAFFQLFLIPPGQYEGCGLSDFKSIEPVEVEMVKVLESALENSRTNEVVEFTCIVRPGMYKCISMQACEIAWDENAPEIIIAEFQDNTRSMGETMRIRELKDTVVQHAGELKRSNENLELFAHGVSHDLRAPLRLMNMIAHELQSQCGHELPDSAAEKVKVLVDTTAELGMLVQNLLDLLQFNRSRLRRKKVDINRLAKASLDAFKDEQRERNVQITFGDLPPSMGDQSLIKQVYTNLLGNAFKFTRSRKNAQIQVGWEQRNGETVYFVSDNGIGLDSSRPDAIFEPFCRLSNARSFEGSGIGLALVKRIVEYHGGRVWADSSVGGGTTIYFTLGAPLAAGKPLIPFDGANQLESLLADSEALPLAR